MRPVVFETSSYIKALREFNKLTVANKYTRGDRPIKLVKGFSYVLVSSSASYLDCEYRFKFDSKIYSREEILQLNKILRFI